MIVLITNSILLGVGLAMDAFSVSLANGLHEPHMKGSKMALIAGVFAVFQTLMPLIGWFVVKKAAEAFELIQPIIPFVAFGLLLFIGGKMIYEGMKGGKEETKEETKVKPVTFGNLMVQGVATSIDALSIGFAIASYSFIEAVISNVIIGLVTFIICIIGLILGRKIGLKLQDKASILGGCVLVAIGLEILITGLF